MTNEPAQPRLWYLNGAFDLQFGRPDRAAYRDQVGEMTAWFVPIAETGEKVILDCQVPSDYPAYLADCGLDTRPSTITGRSGRAEGFMGAPWGWNSEAVSLFRECGAAVDAPDLETVQEVNSRVFSFQVAQKNGFGVPGGVLRYNADDAVASLRSLKTYPWVIKPAYGTSGIGLLVVKTAGDIERACARIVELFAAGQPAVVIEPWIHRVSDISSRFNLDKSGAIESLEHYPTFVTSNGAFYGMGNGPDHLSVARWRVRLEEVAAKTGMALHEKGYFGPVSIDSMIVRNERGGESLVPLLEINARQGMSVIALCLRDRLAADRWWRFRSVGAKRIVLPPDYERWRALLGRDAYDPKTRAGAAVVTPLQIITDTGARPPHRTIFFLSSATAAGLDELDLKLSALIRSPQRG